MRRFLAGILATLWLAASPAIAAIGTPVSMGGATQATGVAAAIALTTTATAPAGSMIFVAGSQAGSGTLSTVTDSNGNSYSAVGACTSNGTNKICDYYTVTASALNSGSTITFTWSVATADKSIVAAYTTGLAASPFDATPTGTAGTSTTPSVTTGTLAQANEIVFGTLFVGNPGATVVESLIDAFTLVVEQTGASGRRTHIGYRITSSTAAVTYAPTLATSQVWIADAPSFKEDSGVATSCRRSLMGVGC